MMEGTTTTTTGLRSPRRELIECQIEHADLDALIDQIEATRGALPDELALRRLKKRRLALRDRMVCLQQWITPQEPA
jgi:hypothetical protein